MDLVAEAKFSESAAALTMIGLDPSTETSAESMNSKRLPGVGITPVVMKLPKLVNEIGDIAVGEWSTARASEHIRR